jgi:hypothetical protein
MKWQTSTTTKRRHCKNKKADLLKGVEFSGAASFFNATSPQ